MALPDWTSTKCMAHYRSRTSLCTDYALSGTVLLYGAAAPTLLLCAVWYRPIVRPAHPICNFRY
eukprot:3193366-Rhodomonas_salina.1